ncbi:MAG TPA: response regulator, partial [Candidatus Thermoplasmatota archaeon]|nr:response regulator [Candidatus Thermoplasmatota archaeon]
MAGAKLLIVDDEPDILLATRSYLTRSFPSLQVETAAGGAEAVARLAQERFDIILSDYRMPGMDGLELLAAASRIAPAAASSSSPSMPGMR